MAAEKFSVLNGPIRCRDPEKVSDIIKAACVLHNYARKREGLEYKPRRFEDCETTTSNIYAIKPPAQNITINTNFSTSSTNLMFKICSLIVEG
jgi:hypothetical protein